MSDSDDRSKWLLLLAAVSVLSLPALLLIGLFATLFFGVTVWAIWSFLSTFLLPLVMLGLGLYLFGKLYTQRLSVALAVLFVCIGLGLALTGVFRPFFDTTWTWFHP